MNINWLLSFEFNLGGKQSAFKIGDRIREKNTKKKGTIKIIHLGKNREGFYAQYTVEWDNRAKEEIGENWIERA